MAHKIKKPGTDIHFENQNKHFTAWRSLTETPGQLTHHGRAIWFQANGIFWLKCLVYSFVISSAHSQPDKVRESMEGDQQGLPFSCTIRSRREEKRSVLLGPSLCCAVSVGVCVHLCILLCKILISFMALGLLFFFFAISGIRTPGKEGPGPCSHLSRKDTHSSLSEAGHMSED